MIEQSVRDFVRSRAAERCEYCLLPQHADETRFHIEHIVARQHSPSHVDEPENLALACHRCNLHKGTNLSSVDPLTGVTVALFHPRLDEWTRHFALEGSRIVGLSPVGRATVQLLQFNAHRRLEFRARLIAARQFDV